MNEDEISLAMTCLFNSLAAPNFFKIDIVFLFSFKPMPSVSKYMDHGIALK